MDNKNLVKTVYVIYYSTYGHIEKLARHICQGLEKSGVSAKLFQFEETLSDKILKKMKAPAKAKDVPNIRQDDLIKADAFMFGFPARHGMIPAQVKYFFDSCDYDSLNKDLTGSLNGGQETVPFTSLPLFCHLGMCFVPIGLKTIDLINSDKVHGGSSYGCGTLADDDNSRQPIKQELDIAEFQGFDFGNFIKRINY